MLQALGASGESRHPKLADRIRFATDLESLWYLRTELLAAITDQVGAEAAGRSLESISTQFVGVLPIATTSRTHRRR
jgi:hypothetical protein